MDRFVTQQALDTSSVAARITAIIAARHERAVIDGDTPTADRYDISLDSIYFAALLLTVVNGTGEIRNRTELLSALDTTQEVIGDLRASIQEGTA